MLQATALQVSVELALHEGRQSPALRTHVFDKFGIMLLDELVKQRLFGTMAAVGATRFRGRTGRRIGLSSRPGGPTIYLRFRQAFGRATADVLGRFTR